MVMDVVVEKAAMHGALEVPTTMVDDMGLSGRINSH
jgi:hypothetical protein